MLLDLDARSFVASWWVFPAQAVIALAVPVAAVTLPLRRLSRIPVREGIASGSTAPARCPAGDRRVGPRWGREPSRWDAATRVRQPGRLALTAASLAVGAAAVMTASNTGGAWDRIVSDEFSAQDFDVQVQLVAPSCREDRSTPLRPSAGLTRIEYWSAATATVTGPDGHIGDDAVALLPPEDSTSATFPLVDGRRLIPGEEHAVMVSPVAHGSRSGRGRRHPARGGRFHAWTVVGVVRQLSGGQGRSRVALRTLGHPWTPAPANVSSASRAQRSRQASLDAAEAILADAGVSIAARDDGDRRQTVTRRPLVHHHGPAAGDVDRIGRGGAARARRGDVHGGGGAAWRDRADEDRGRVIALRSCAWSSTEAIAVVSLAVAERRRARAGAHVSRWRAPWVRSSWARRCPTRGGCQAVGITAIVWGQRVQPRASSRPTRPRICPCEKPSHVANNEGRNTSWRKGPERAKRRMSILDHGARSRSGSSALGDTRGGDAHMTRTAMRNHLLVVGRCVSWCWALLGAHIGSQ